MKLTVLGGGGFRVPYVYEALLDAPALRVEELALYDLDVQRLNHLRLVLTGIEQERGQALPLCITTDLNQAVDGADVILCAIRVGGLAGRVIDERVAVSHGVIGQETTGPGGVCLGLRSVPVLVAMAQVVARRAPRAWFINLTNPVGLTTQAVQTILGNRAIGVCDTPPSLCRRVASALNRAPHELWFDYFGINHLGWLRTVSDQAQDWLPVLLADPSALANLEETYLFGAERLRSLGMIPNEYLVYYYAASRVFDTVAARGFSRAEQLITQQQAFYSAPVHTPRHALAAWRAARDARDESYMAEARPSHVEASDAHGASFQDRGYAGIAVALAEALLLSIPAVMILNTANRGSLPFLEADAVVEVPCVVGASGAIPIASGDVQPEARRLLEAVKRVEQTAIEAALSRSYDLALKALALHPLVPSEVARGILDDYLTNHLDMRERFA